MKFLIILFSFVFLLSCTDNPDPNTVVPYSPVTYYPNPFSDTVTVQMNSSSNWEISFLDKSGNNIKKYNGQGNSSFKIGFDNKENQTIIAQTKIGTTIYVTELLSIGK
jgi:uncharacterized lipoprotein YajG